MLAAKAPKGAGATAARATRSSPLKHAPIRGADFLRAGGKIAVGGVGWTVGGAVASKGLLAVAPGSLALLLGSKAVLVSLFVGVSGLSFGMLGLWRGSLNAANFLLVQRRLLTAPAQRFLEQLVPHEGIDLDSKSDVLGLVRDGYEQLLSSTSTRGVVSRVGIAVLLPRIDAVLSNVEEEIEAVRRAETHLSAPALIASVTHGLIQERIAYFRDTPTYVALGAYLALFGGSSALYGWMVAA